MHKEQMHCLSHSKELITHLERNEKCMFCEVIYTNKNCIEFMREELICGNVNAP